MDDVSILRMKQIYLFIFFWGEGDGVLLLSPRLEGIVMISAHCNLHFLGLSDCPSGWNYRHAPPCLANFFCIFSRDVGFTMLARMVSISWPCDPPTSASQRAGITGINHRPQPKKKFLNIYTYLHWQFTLIWRNQWIK